MLVAVASAQGGYFPTSWGWTAALLGWVALIILLVGDAPRLGPLDLAFAGGVAALAAWIALSRLWTTSPTQTPLEVERAFVYVAAAVLAVVVVRRDNVRLLVGSATAAVSLVALYSLGTRLFPDRLGRYEPIAGYRLAAPLGYWNGLGAFAAMGVLLALGFALFDRRDAVRGAAAAALPVLATTLYFTFSRGGWLALFLSLLVLVAVTPRRLYVMFGLPLLAAAPAVAVFGASRAKGLTRTDAVLSQSAPDGHKVALLVVGSAIVAVGAGLLLAALERRIDAPARARTAAAFAVALILAAAAAGLFARYGSPPSVARRAWHAFTAKPDFSSSDLNARLFSASSNGRWQQWQVALDAWKDKPVLGIGAGAYERYWFRHRPYVSYVRDVHSLYIETLAELGPLGLVLLLVALGAPVAAFVRTRREPLAAAIVAAYAVYVIHALVDWDWELPALGLVAFLCAGALLALVRGGAARPVRAPLLALTAVATAGAIAGLGANIALGRSSDAFRRSDSDAALRLARRAQELAPWSAEPWRRLGEIQLDAGRRAEAARDFRKALAKDDGEWRTWLGLYRATGDPAARAQAERLNPLIDL